MTVSSAKCRYNTANKHPHLDISSSVAAFALSLGVDYTIRAKVLAFRLFRSLMVWMLLLTEIESNWLDLQESRARLITTVTYIGRQDPADPMYSKF